MDATVHVTGPKGERAIAFADFHRLPGDTPQRDTNLHADEIVIAVELPAQGFAQNYTYLKIRDRLSYAFALVSVAAALELDGDTIKEARVALGGVAHKPWRDADAEASLRGQTADRAAFAQAADAAFARRQRLRAQRLQDRSGAPRHCACPHPGGARHAAIAIQQENPVNAMAYVGTPTSRIDGHAKVTGAAKYAGEFNTNGLAHGAVVASTIAKGRIVRIDASDALRVEGVLDVLTHENRPPMARANAAYKDDVAPEEGSPFRPLYDDKIKFSGQPIALVLAEEWEIARFAASLLRIEYKEADFVTDLQAQRDKAFAVPKPEKPRGNADRAYAAAAVRHEAEYFIPTEHHNPMELYAATAVWHGDGKLTVYDKTQGVQNVQRYLCAIFELKPDDLRVISPFVGGAFGSGLRPQYEAVLAVLAARALQRSVRLVLTRQQMYGLGHRPASIERLALGAATDGTLQCDHPRGDRGHLAIRRFFPQRHRMVRSALQKRQR